MLGPPKEEVWTTDLVVDSDTFVALGGGIGGVWRQWQLYIYIYSIYIRFSLGVLLSTLKCNAHLIELLDLGTPTLLTSLIHPLVAAGEETVCLDAACSFIMSLWEEQTLVLSRPQDFYSICFWHLLAIRARPQE